MTKITPTPLDGISYYTPLDGYILSGRDDLVHIPWQVGIPIPLVEQDYQKYRITDEMPDYDAVGRGIYQAFRRNPTCSFAEYYAAILKDAYPHIISELGGQIVMLEAKEVDTPYLDRKIIDLKIMALIDPFNAGVLREIARTYIEKGSRLATLHQAVYSWYAAEKNFEAAMALDPDDYIAGYEYGETLYVLGKYAKATKIWNSLLPKFNQADRIKLKTRINDINAGFLPLVSPLDYLSAIAVAVEERQAERYESAIVILEDVMADKVFCDHFPTKELCYLIGTCYQEMGLMDKAAEAFNRS